MTKHRPHHPHHPHHPHLAMDGAASSAYWNPPVPEDIDYEYLHDALGNQDIAKTVFRMLQRCPTEVAAVATLVLRVFKEIKNLEMQISDLQNELKSVKQGEEN